MAQDITKHLERAKRYLEKSKIQEAVAEYQAVLEVLPSHQESIQALGDLHARLNNPERAAHYYGIQFDRLMESGDLAKAAAVYARFLRAAPQPPERLASFAFLLQRQNRVAEAIALYSAAAKLFFEHIRLEEAVTCLEKIAQLDPDNSECHVKLAEAAARLGKNELAAHGYLRAGQLALAAEDLELALDFFGRAHALAPRDRSVALLYAEACLRKGEPAEAVRLLESFSPGEMDTTFLVVFGEALLRAGELDRARPVLVTFYKQKQENFKKLFELAEAYLAAGLDDKAVDVLAETKKWMFRLRRENEFTAQFDQVAEAYPASLLLAESWARIYEELNRESKYFDVLVKLFDLYYNADKLKEACDSLDRLVDIDPYDYRNQDRIAKLEGKVDPAYLRSLTLRAGKATESNNQNDQRSAGQQTGGDAGRPENEEAKTQQVLDDLMVQVEIFLQYSLRPKAYERLERIAEMFPGEEEKNERLYALYERAEWWPKGAPPIPKDASAVEAASAKSEAASRETSRDLAEIAEITSLMYRQATPREVLAVAVNEIGKYLGVARCLISIGPPNETRPLEAGYVRAGMEAAGTAAKGAALAEIVRATPDSLGAIELRGETTAALADLGLVTALGAQLTDKETQSAAGVLLIGDSAARAWKPNESFFLQAIGDQIVMSVSHTRLRSLVRTLGAADEKTGLLSRGAYLDCLLAEVSRARAQNMPVALAILQLDRGAELLREHGEAALEAHMELLAKALQSSVRQTDLSVKYTTWSLAFILPNTTLEQGRAAGDKLRRVAAGVKAPWSGPPPTMSAIVAEATNRAHDEREDVVTEWINRAEFGLDEAQQNGGDTILELATPR
jgi:tetratricopeptide (TPR) repeat protein/GGDEF domain-containing protein